MQQRDIASPVGDFSEESLVVAILEKDDSGVGEAPSPVTFPAKYVDFADVFDKHKTDILPKHTQHNLAIEIENDKIFLV